MTSLWANGILNRRAAWVLAAATQMWVGCSGTRSQQPSGAGAAGDAAAGHLEGGGCNDEASPGGALHDCAPDAAAGASNGLGGSAGARDAAGAGAGGIAGAGDGGQSGAPNGFVPAPHAAFPLVTKHAGPVLKNIQIVPVYFGEDPLRADLELFNSWIVTSDYWTKVATEYGAQAGTRLPAVQFESAPSAITDVQIAKWIDARVADGSLPKPTANTVFALFYQASTTITNFTGTNCHAFAAYHASVSLANPVYTGDVVFAVIPRCSYSAGDELMIATDVASHEYREAATNPLNFTNPGWIMDNVDGPLEAWGMLSGPAVADLCLSQSYDVIEGFTVQDIWSNTAAKAGNNPCQPSDPKRPYFTVSAETTIYHAQPGETVAVHAVAWSNLPAPDWSIEVNWGLVPYSDFDGQAALSRMTVNNGDEVTATVTIPPDPPMVDGRSVYRFTIDSIDPINPNFSHPWPILIVVP